MIQLIFITMIALLYYAAGTFDLKLFLYTYIGGTWLITLILIERDIRAQRLAE